MFTLQRAFLKLVIFTLFAGVVTGCSAQRSSLLPVGGEASAQARASQARIVSKVVRAGGKTYVIDELATPISATLEAIAPGGDSHMWFTGGSIVGKSSITGDMTDYLFPAYGRIGSIVEGPDRNLWVALQNPGAFGKITSNGQLDAFPLPKKFRQYITLAFQSQFQKDPAVTCGRSMTITPTTM
jgi:streptogramin lyase